MNHFIDRALITGPRSFNHETSDLSGCLFPWVFQLLFISVPRWLGGCFGGGPCSLHQSDQITVNAHLGPSLCSSSVSGHPHSPSSSSLFPPICPPSSPPRPSRSLSDFSGWAFWTGFGLGLGAVRGVRPSIRRRPARPKHQAAIIPESCLVRCSPTSSPMSVHTLLIPPMRPLRNP
jgi:hypothetical protein